MLKYFYNLYFQYRIDDDNLSNTFNIGYFSTEKRAKELISVIRENPYRMPPPYEKLAGDLKGLYSRRINQQHRLVYEVFEREQTIKIVSLWSHYER